MRQKIAGPVLQSGSFARLRNPSHIRRKTKFRHALKADPEMQRRLEELIHREKTSGLTGEEKDELDHYIVLERLIRLAKARAQYILAQ